MMAVADIVRNVTATSGLSRSGFGGEVERTIAEERVRVGVQHHGEIAVVDTTRGIEAHGVLARRIDVDPTGPTDGAVGGDTEVRARTVVAEHPRLQRGVDEEGMTGPTFE